jgi:hypothetical protein
MGDLLKRRTSPALVVAVMALIAAVAGAAVASPSAEKSAKAVTPGKAKNIANSEITKRAPGLSVASAATANNATNATNASQLGGVSASGYQHKVLFAVIDAGALAINRTNVPGATLDTSGPIGDWEIDFNAGDLDPCASTATLSDPGFSGTSPAGEVSTGQGPADSDQIHANTYNSAGAAADISFTVTVVC